MSVKRQGSFLLPEGNVAVGEDVVALADTGNEDTLAETSTVNADVDTIVKTTAGGDVDGVVGVLGEVATVELEGVEVVAKASASAATARAKDQGRRGTLIEGVVVLALRHGGSTFSIDGRSGIDAAVRRSAVRAFDAGVWRGASRGAHDGDRTVTLDDGSGGSQTNSEGKERDDGGEAHDEERLKRMRRTLVSRLGGKMGARTQHSLYPCERTKINWCEWNR